MKAPYYIIGAMLIWIIFRECVSPPKPLPPSIQAHQDTIRLDEAQIKSYEAQLNVIAHERYSIEQNAKSREKAFKIENTRLRSERDQARLKAPPEVLADPLVLIQDSLINQQAGRITELETIQVEKDSNFTASLRVMELKFDAQKDISDHQAAINSELFRTLNRERRRGKAWKVAVPAALVIGFLIGNEL